METVFFYDKEQAYDALLQSAEDWIFISDCSSGITKVPQKMAEYFNLPGTYIEGFYDLWLSKVHDDDKPIFIRSIKQMAESNEFSIFEHRVMNGTGNWIWVKIYGNYIREDDSGKEMFVGMIVSMDKFMQIDNTTGLLNKYEFEIKINEFLKKKKNLSVMILNVDNFRNINELYDRDFGDCVLSITGRYIEKVLPANAWAYRLDGDEFGVIISGSDKKVISDVFFNIQNHFSVQQEYNGKKYHCTLSAGAYQLSVGVSEDVQTLRKKVNKALDYSKMHGKNKLTFYVPTISEDKTRELEIIEMLHESVEKNYEGFEVFCQPQVMANSHKLKGAEALLRWRCEKYGDVSPFEFIPILEKTNLIIPVGRWVFEQAVKSCKDFIGYNSHFKMSVNISYMQLLDNDFLEFMKYIIESENISFSNMIVELTESRFVSDKELLKDTFSYMRNLGMKIAMDDFGTGYSSLEILKEVPADIVKIDKVFVKNIKNSSFDMTFIKFIVELCHDVGIKVCLEGVERYDEMEIVSDMNLDFIQGYLFGKPQDKNSFFKNYLIKS